MLQGVNAGTFRKDLYYRLRTHHLQLPPLRERTDDLPLLVGHFAEKAARALGKPAPMIPLALHQLLKSYCFPGNLRELEAMVVDAVARQRGRTLSLESFKDAMSGSRLASAGKQMSCVPTSIAGRLSRTRSRRSRRRRSCCSQKHCAGQMAIKAWPRPCSASRVKP